MTARRKVLGSLIGLLALVVILSAENYFSPPAMAAEESIKVGAPLPLTGRHAAFGKRQYNGFELAVSHINAEGGIKGKKLEFVYEDTVGEPKNSMAATKKLITQSKVPVLIGEFSSSSTYADAQVAQSYKTPFIVSIGSADNIMKSGWDWVFRVHPATSDYPRAIEEFWSRAIGFPKSLVIVHEETLWGTSVAESMGRLCKNRGIQVLLRESYETGIVDLKPLLLKVKALKPQVVFTTSYLLDGALFMRQAKEINLNAEAFYGSGAETSPEYLQAAGAACDYQFTIDWFNKSLPFPGVKRFYDEYLKKYGEEPVYHAALCYASVQVLSDCLRRAKSIDKEEIKKALETADVTTIIGQVKFENYDGFLHQDKPVILLSQWQKGQLFPIYPADAATAKHIYPAPSWDKR